MACNRIEEFADASSADNRDILHWHSYDSERVIHSGDLQNVLAGVNASEVIEAVGSRHGLGDYRKRAIWQGGEERDGDSGERAQRLGVWVYTVDSSPQVRSAHGCGRQQENYEQNQKLKLGAHRD
jgi:hypothetical protein